MPYKVGVSSGWWHIGKDPNLRGMPRKIAAFGAVTGVTFNQVDLETITEFVEPGLKENVKRAMEKVGIDIGLHGELGEYVALESAERRYWEQSHERLCITLKFSAELGFKYVIWHTSQKEILNMREQQIRPFGYQYEVVGPDGKPLYKFCDAHPASKSEARKYVNLRYMDEDAIEKENIRLTKEAEKKRREELHDLIENRRAVLEKHLADRPKEERDRFIKEELQAYERDISPQLIDNWKRWVNQELNNFDNVYAIWKKAKFGQYFVESGEIAANMIVAASMKAEGDPLWKNICKDLAIEDAYHNRPIEFNAAVSARYIEGHITTKDNVNNKQYLNGMSVKEWCNKTGLVLALEMPTSSQGTEGRMRLFDPRHTYFLIKKLGSPKISLCIDFEQTLAQNIDLDKIMEGMPDDIGKLTYVFHLGEPIPYFGTAHVPIQLGGRGQETIYRWLHILRKKGFKDGILIFERGEGRTMAETFEQSVIALKQMVKYLEMDVKPDDLPPEFYGISFENKEIFAQQQVIISEHSTDPLTGLFMIPEERHTFLGKSAVEKGKREEWERGKYK